MTLRLRIAIAAAALGWSWCGSAQAQPTAPAAMAARSAPDDWRRVEASHTPEGWVCVNWVFVFDNMGFRHFVGAACNGDNPPALLSATVESWVDCKLDRSQGVDLWFREPGPDGKMRLAPEHFARDQMAARVADAVCG